MGSGPLSPGGAKLSGIADIPAAQGQPHWQPHWHPSPNFGPRRDGLTPSLVVIHYTAMDSANAALHRLCDPRVEVSAHYLIGADGCCWQMVAESQRAWHAGAGQWRGLDDINSRSIGIELDNCGSHPFGEPQMAALETLLAQILRRWPIPPQGVIGHSDMAPGRKIDPGPRFDWPRLARQGLAQVTPAVPAVATAGVDQTLPDHSFTELARAAGYSCEASAAELLQAMRQRHRPWGQGGLGPQDIALARALALDPGPASA